MVSDVLIVSWETLADYITDFFRIKGKPILFWLYTDGQDELHNFEVIWNRVGFFLVVRGEYSIDLFSLEGFLQPSQQEFFFWIFLDTVIDSSD